MAAGRLTDMERLAREALAEKPDDVDFAVLVAYAARRQLTASPPDYTHAAAAAEFSQRAIALLEAGKLPTVYDRATWSRDRTLAWLHETLAILDAREDRTDAALAHYREATRLDPSGPAGFLGCGSLHQRKYLEAVGRFQAFSEDDRREPARKPEVKAALDQVDREADLVIECWVPFLALTPNRPEWADTRQSVRKVLGELYAYRHPDTPGGLDRLIESAAAKAPRP
jgi:tetratricopeptide (TPR) repeat protein